jgi:hypothetical protein
LCQWNQRMLATHGVRAICLMNKTNMIMSNAQ